MGESQASPETISELETAILDLMAGAGLTKHHRLVASAANACNSL